MVDDERDAREYLQVALGEFGADVRAVSSVREGLDLVERWRPRLVVCDIAMPGEDGYAFISRLRALPEERGGDTRAVALTAHAGPEERMRALKAGFLEHLTKPVEPAALAAVVSSLA